MWDPSRGRLRALRAGVAGMTVAVIAVASHILGGGGHSSWIAVVPAAIGVTLATLALGRRQLHWMTLLSLLGAAQLGVHYLSAYLMGHMSASGADMSMLAWHIVGAALSAALLSRGESLLWRLHAWLTPRVLDVLARPVIPEASNGPTWWISPAPQFLLVSGPCAPRGPPLPR